MFQSVSLAPNQPWPFDRHNTNFVNVIYESYYMSVYLLLAAKSDPLNLITVTFAKVGQVRGKKSQQPKITE